ncbi:hypothetical protein BMW22_15775 [Rhizobium leguminosarum]|uniref:HNH nuclease domain-containing protein n=1 Tax=Rhizobium leguminosarum TaxID=384 RepID=A0A1L3ZB50_RHILE|nr:HNH endonuclease [Rhizobium leguminosarum]API52884.1 hypothetical protein BMW22_15775 [Rhizobium leguminosarum]
MKQHPSQELLRQLLDYDPVTGKLFWKIRPAEMFNAGSKFTSQHNANTWNTRYAGKEAFASKNGHGYHQGSIFKRKYEAHRVIWAWMTGEWPPTVDHENGDIENNRWRNLKAKSRAGNQRNLGLRKNNTTGINGVVKHASGRWRAMMMIGRKCKTLGYFDTKEEAAVCRLAANEKYGFHKNHGRSV